jgi:hypothetical protein
MSKNLRVALFVLCFLAPVTALPQQPAETPGPAVAPIPTQLLTAKRVFVGNGAGDDDPALTKYTNGPNGLYNQFYAGVKNLGQYEIVAVPGDADIVLELRVDYAHYNHAVTYPKFRLEVRDPKTNVLLWSFTEPVNGAFFAKTGRRNVAQSLGKLADDLKRVSTNP